MKELKTSYLFKIGILLALNLYFKNIILFLLSLLFLLINNTKSLLIFLSLLFIGIVCSNIKQDYISYGIVEEKYDYYVIVQKLFYRIRIENSDLNIGDLVKTYNSSIVVDNNLLKNNIRFKTTDYQLINNFRIRSAVFRKVEEYGEATSAYLKKIIYNQNTYDIDLLDIGYGFSFYYLLILIKQRKRVLAIFILLIYIVLFSYDIKFYLIIIDLILAFTKLSNLDKLAIKIITISLINVKLFLNYSILISLLLSLYFMSELKYDKSYFSIFQSLIFNEINIFTLFFFKYLVYFRIFMFIISILLLVFPEFESLYLNILSIISKFITLSNISIRGKLNLISIILIMVIEKVFRIKNQYIRIVIIILFLLLPINNPFKHISFIDVGQGDSILIKGELDRYNVLIDTGSKYNYYKLKRQLYKEGIYTLDYLIISHLDNDHSENIESLMRDFKIKQIIYNGYDIKIGNEEFKYLYSDVYSNDNDNSLVYLLNINDYKVLFTGDISKNVENSILKKYSINDIDILKVSHHGSSSATSRFFVGNLMPRFAIISTSGAYNHPSKEVLDNLEDYLVNVFITKNSGTITFVFNNFFNYIITDIGEFAIINE